MLCAVCDEAADNETCPRCGGALLLHGRFELERLLGAGGQSRVYAGRDRQDGGVVAIKIMSLARVREWKNVELFRRAAGVLGGLHHPGIPRLVEYFEETRSSAALYCLVHELIDGETLAQAQKQGLRFDEGSARALLVELLGILRYLHGLSPPVIHRDIKPSNLMRRRDGRLVLIDFDLVRDVMMPDGGATTTAGTAGYTPIEQYAGDALPASDLYAAGATMAALLSHKEPLDLRAAGEQRLALAEHIHVGKSFLAVLQKMVEPELRARYQSADEVLVDLATATGAAGASATPAKRRPLLWLVPGLLVAASAVAALMLVGSTTAVKSVPAPILTPPTPPVPPPPLTPPVAPVEAPPQIASHLPPETVAAALTQAPLWEGLVDKTHVQIRFSGSAAKLHTLKGQLTIFDASGRGRTLLPLKVEIATLGTLTLRARTVEDGTNVELTFYGELNRARTTITGTRETHYDATGSAYVTEDQFSVSVRR